MMNKKAFTLIELLAVIVILGTLAAIVAVSVSAYINDAYEASYNNLVDTIESSTEIYVADHSSEYPQLDVAGSTFDIPLSSLVEDEYIGTSKLVDERTGETIPLTATVQVTVVSKNKINVDFNYEP